MKKTELYKVLLPGGEPAHGGSGKWSLPNGRRPGAWMPTIAKPKCCERGYHLVTAVQLIKWLDCNGLEVWEAEGCGDHHDQEDKSAWAEARLVRYIGQWTERNARLFAADCAEAVLYIFEKERPNDDRPRKAIEAARAFALGKIDAATMAAAGEAAWSAGSAARSATWSAARAAAWSAARSAWFAAEAASEFAAGAAAGSAARDAAWNKQTHRLLYWLKKGKP